MKICTGYLVYPDGNLGSDTVDLYVVYLALLRNIPGKFTPFYSSSNI